MRRILLFPWDCAVSAVALTAFALWTLWNLPAIARACAEEERDERMKAADGGAA